MRDVAVNRVCARNRVFSCEKFGRSENKAGMTSGHLGVLRNLQVDSSEVRSAITNYRENIESNRASIGSSWRVGGVMSQPSRRTVRQIGL